MENDFKKIKVAFIKVGGITSGGTEKFLQIIATNLPKDKFEVDYYYSDPVFLKKPDRAPSSATASPSSTCLPTGMSPPT